MIPMFPSHEDDNIPSPYDYSDLESDITDPLFGPSAVNSVSALKIGDNQLNLDHTGKPLTYKTALQGPNVVHWIAANSAEFRRLIQKTKIMHPIMHDQLPTDRKGDVTYYNPTTKEKIINGVRAFRVFRSS